MPAVRNIWRRMDTSALPLQLTRALIKAVRSESVRSPTPIASRDERTLRESMDRVLAERPAPDEGIWVFAYGSLLWKRSFDVAEEMSGIGYGFERRYCLWDDRDRGTPERPGLTLALVP